MRRVVVSALFLLYLNALFTFENVPSTPAMRFVPKLSLEVLLLVAGLALVAAFGIRLSSLFRCILAVVLFVATLVRYVDVTALGVLGREFDLHGDFPHLHRVFAMFWEAMTLSTGLAVVGVLALLCAVAVSLNWVGLGVLERALRDPWFRRTALSASVLLAAFAPSRFFAVSVSSIVARQIRSLDAGVSDPASLAEIDFPEERFDSNLDGLGGAHVFLIFLESYGVTLFEDGHHFEKIAPRYRELEARLREAGYAFSSSQIQSPTFGGGSWRAHASLLSGVHVESEHIYNALLASERRTLVHVLHEKGYRTVAGEPGIKWYWPDGLFYDFDKIYDFDAIDYDGPAMGWWKIPDQFTLYRVYKDEIRGATAPVFAKFSLIMTHIPYFPVPSYVDDWERFDDGTAYGEGLRSVAHDAYSDLMELSKWYLGAVGYELDVLEGFLLKYVPENSLVIIMGDHQPPKLATHDNDSWAVPMHVLSKRVDLVRAFDPLGFREGMVPLEPSSFRMADFLRSFLEIYDGRATD